MTNIEFIKKLHNKDKCKMNKWKDDLEQIIQNNKTMKQLLEYEYK